MSIGLVVACTKYLIKYNNIYTYVRIKLHGFSLDTYLFTTIKTLCGVPLLVNIKHFENLLCYDNL